MQEIVSEDKNNVSASSVVTMLLISNKGRSQHFVKIFINYRYIYIY